MSVTSSIKPTIESTEKVTPHQVARDNADAVKLLGPGPGLDSSLARFANTYGTAVKAFDSLLQFPFLDSLKVTITGTEDAAATDFRQIIQDGKLKFNYYAGQEVAGARNLIAYSKMPAALLKTSPPSQYATSVQPLIQKFSDEAERTQATKKYSLEKLNGFISDVDGLMTSTTRNIQDLTSQIASQKEVLHNASVVKTLKKALNILFKLATSDTDVKSQLSILLGLAIEILDGSFDSLFLDNTRLKALIASLERLRDTLLVIKATLGALRNSLRVSMEVTQQLNGVWITIGDNLVELFDSNEILTPRQLTRVENAWNATVTAANDMIATISGATRPRQPMESTPVLYKSDFEPSLPLPKTAADLAIFQAAEKAGKSGLLASPSNFAKLHETVQNESVQQRIVEKVVSQFRISPNSLASKLVSTSTEASYGVGTAGDENAAVDEFLKAFSPPADVQEALETLAGDCQAVMKQFDDILQLPYLDSLMVINPFKGLPGDPTTDNDKIDIRSMVTHYRRLYENLQADSVVAVRGLVAYSTIQIIQLPLVTPFPERPSDISVDDYTTNNQEIVEQHKNTFSDLHQKYVRFGQTWHDAQNNLLQAIATAKTEVESLEKQISEKLDEIKNKTLWGLLEVMIGGLLFAAAAFLPGGIIFAFVGAGLLIKGIADLISAGQLQNALAGIRSTLETTKQTQKRLESLIEPMQKVADSITKITLIFNDIATQLAVISSGMLIWSLPNLFITLQPQVIEAWKSVKNDCFKYIEVISGKRLT